MCKSSAALVHWEGSIADVYSVMARVPIAGAVSG